MGRTQAEQEDAVAWLKRDRERRRNGDYWNAHYIELSKRHPNKWVLIYDGDTVRVFDGLREMQEAKRCLPTWQRDTAYDHFVRTKARVG